MSRKEIELLRDEVATLEAFLADLTEDDIIERMQLEVRLEDARARLAEFLSEPQAKTLPITFRGRPVEGMRSIDAGFASQALRAFVEATDTVAASLVEDDLKARGRLPGAGARSLRIVDTARGSFGFELELPPVVEEQSAEQASLFQTEQIEPVDVYAEAIETTFALLDQAAKRDEQAISDLVTKVHPRAAKKVWAFAKVLAEHQAVFTATFEGKQVRFDDDDQVRRVMEALAENDISEERELRSGTLLGILPEAREFEARLDDGTIVRGKIHGSVEPLMEVKAAWENKPASLRLRIVRVRTTRRYELMGVGSSEGGEQGP